MSPCCFKFCCRCLQILYNFWTSGSMFLFCTGLRILCRSCSNPSTSCCHCLIAIALVQTKTTSCLEHLNSHLTNWSPQSVLHTEATIRLWTINQVLSFMCSRGFSSQVKLHPNPWPWPTSPAGHDLASGSFLSYHFPLVVFLSLLHLACPLCFSSNIWAHFCLRTTALTVPSA